MRLIALITLAAVAAAQTATYPGAVVTDNQLRIAANNIQTTITFPMLSSDTTILVSNSTGIVANSTATIDNEHIAICNVSGNSLTVGKSSCPNVDGRGFDGSSAAAHANGASLALNIDAWHHNAMKEEVKAVENALGPNLGNITALIPPSIPNPLTVNKGGTGVQTLTGVAIGNGTGAFTAVVGSAPRQALRVKPNQTPLTYEFSSPVSVSTADYNFPAQTPGGSIAIGSNTITLAPCPLGVAGTDTRHRLYISGGTGTAEGVLITGGTCTSGASSGTVIVTAAAVHTGAWMVQSATSGIVEAAWSIANIGTITMPLGQVPIHSTTVLPTTLSLTGQGFGGVNTSNGTTLMCDAAADPCIVIADGLGTATFQGLGVHSNYGIYGTGSGSGLWIGGDPSSVFAPTAWTGSYIHTYNIQVVNFAIGLVHRRGNFNVYTNSIFSGSTNALYFPAGSGGEHQPLEFHGCLLTVPTGNAVRMDESGFTVDVVQFHGGQVSGTITGNDVFWESWGTHFEPNDLGSGLVNITGASALIKIHGGLLSVHGTNPSTTAAMFNFNGAGTYFFTVDNAQVQADTGVTVTSFVNYVTSLNGGLRIEKNDFAPAGVFTHLYTISKATLDANVSLYVNQPTSQTNTGVPVGATITFPLNNYPITQRFAVFGGTVGGSGITAVAGLTPYVNGTLITTSAQTFTAGATIGNTITTVAGLPYTFYFDGTRIWIK